MRIGYSPEQEELRRELRAYFAKLMTPERVAALSSSDGEVGSGNVYRDTVAQMGKDGWLTLNWPTEFGGQGRTPMDSLIFTDEAAIAGAPVPFLTINSVAPTIMAFGTDEQKKFFLPKIAAGELHFAIGYSEPGAGTDLAALRTTAVRDGDDYVINGQKMWTSLIAYADYVWLAVRTNPEAKKHRGISMLIVPTTADGFSWTPVHTMAGVDTSATYYQDVRVPDLEPGRRGERRLEARHQPAQPRARRAGVVPTDLPGARRRSGLGAEHQGQPRQAADRLGVGAAQPRSGARQGRGAQADQLGARIQPRRHTVACRCIGGQGVRHRAGHRGLPPAHGGARHGGHTALRLRRRAAARTGRADAPVGLILTFGGGTNEIQRDIIGMVALGLPRVNR